MKSFLVEDILSHYDVPDTKRDKQGLKSLVLGRRNLHVWKTSHVLGIINENAQLSKKTRHRPENEISIDDTHLISILFTPRYKYSKQASSLNGDHNDISRG